MRSNVPSVSAAPERLRSIAEVIDTACADPTDAGVLVSIEVDDDDVVLGIRRLDPALHPTIELAALAVSDRWWALCLCTSGRAHFLDQPDRPAAAITSTYAVARDGTEVSLLRRGDEVVELPGPTAGRIPDLLRRILEVPRQAGPRP